MTVATNIADAPKVLDAAKQLNLVQPDPELTPDGMVARAAALRERLREEQAQTEERTFYSQELHQAMEDAGLYRVYVPRMFGGYAFDVPTYLRVVIEVARGCMSSGWCFALATAHALQVASWWPEQAQREIFGEGDFRAAGVAAPVGPIAKSGEGYVLNGKVSFCSGIPVSSHYMGQALMPSDEPGPPRMAAFVASREDFTILDDWGYTIGLKGSGSHSIVFQEVQLPEHWVLEDYNLLDGDVENGTPGLRLHENPLYAGRSMGHFVMELAAVMVGGAWLALDEFEAIIREKMTPMPPFRPRLLDPDYQRWYGEAITKIAAAENMLLHLGERHMELCRRAAGGGAPFSRAEDLLLCTQAREVIVELWHVMTDIVVPTVGAAALSNGERVERVFRDMATAMSHRNMMLKEFFFGETTRGLLGIAPDAA